MNNMATKELFKFLPKSSEERYGPVNDASKKWNHGHHYG